jgi:oligopeptide/dipeptide ABC transporter ATP-binding protein
MHKEVLLELVDVKKYFPIKKGLLQRVKGHVKAVDGVSLKIYKGETLGLVGESGCGKSTLGRTMLLLHPPTEGQIMFEDECLTDMSTEQLRLRRRDFQMVFQDPSASLNARHTIKQIIEEPMKIHHLFDSKVDRLNTVKRLMESVGMNHSQLNRKPGEFSGGQKQRIGIARSLALNPKLIVADEPVSALDVSIQSQVINLMQDLQKEFHLTYVFISHDLSVVKHISDRIGVMYLGKIVELREKEELYADPLHPYTKALISSIPIPDPTLERERIILTGDLPNPANPPSGCHFHTRCPVATEMCTMRAPSLKEIRPGSWVSCHLYD